MKTAYPDTSEQMVLNKLRTQIIEGELPAGEFLSQRKLAQSTGSSVISVRGALRQLENDGLIENIPRWGVRIPKETPEVIKDRYRIRELLETYTVECLSKNLTQNQIESIVNQAEELDKLAVQSSSKSALAFARLHQDFHIYLAKCCESLLLVKLLERVMNASTMILNAKRTWTNPTEGGGVTHGRLAEIIINGSTAQAVQAMRTHVRDGLNSELEAIK